ncbi:hypothetical protein [uncultured Rikenella sp.]|uniref:hypothetical protein n=1 Tax=uncultured Rikenella sp. TaxID=368003 RepID=UPI00262E3C88|nr:hypothetical protein [uncultured Rikenella sp.]
MTLDKAALQSGILALLTDMRSRTEVSDSDFAGTLADLIDTYIRSATITIAAGIPVSTAGGPTAQTGTTTAPAVATIQ